ncbi:MAG TPA: FAD-dependent oxidoreductase, partial [Anaerolineae bacterium]
ASYGDAITLKHNRATLQADGTIALSDGSVIHASRIVIATGAHPSVLPLEGIGKVQVLDSTTAMALKTQPRSLIIIGGRAIALELGQVFARLGTQVTILQRSAKLIPEHEPEIAGELAQALRDEGIAIHTLAQPQAIREENGEKVIAATVNGQAVEFRAEHVLMAVGRTPNTQNMGLEEANVKLDAHGFIIVNDFLQTSNPRIYAVGDATQLPKLVYVAAMSGGIAARNALEGNSQRLDLTVLPEVIFTDPQVATVGLTEAAATAHGYDVQVSQMPLSYVPRALAARDVRGVVKLVADKDSGRLLGAHMLAAEAGEVIQTAAMALRFGLQSGFTVNDLSGMLFPYLTQVEGLKLAAIGFKKDLAQLSCCAS